MSNVVTTQHKKNMDRAMRARFIMLAGAMLLLAAFVALLSLAPTYLFLRIATTAIERSEQNVPPEARQDQMISFATTNIVQALTPIANATSSPSAGIAAALALRPAGASITTVTYSKGTLTLTGKAARRESITNYRAALEKSGLFSSVQIPVSALVGAQDGKFTITLKGTF